jgi:hypothetical protein
MEIERFLEWTSKLEKRKKGKKEEMERLERYFERFHLLNRKYLDKETYEKAQGTIPSMAEALTNTIRYLEEEITRLRNKRMKIPFENVELGEMQRIQRRNEMLMKEYLTEVSAEEGKSTKE